jgi:hypothetical protein
LFECSYDFDVTEIVCENLVINCASLNTTQRGDCLPASPETRAAPAEPAAAAGVAAPPSGQVEAGADPNRADGEGSVPLAARASAAEATEPAAEVVLVDLATSSDSDGFQWPGRRHRQPSDSPTPSEGTTACETVVEAQLYGVEVCRLSPPSFRHQ